MTNIDDLIQQIERATELERGYLLGKLLRAGLQQREEGSFSAAEEVFTKAMEFDTGNQARYFLGTTYFKKERSYDALQEFQKILAEDPEHQDALYMSGKCYHTLGDVDQAVPFYHAVIDRGIKTERTRGWVSWFKGTDEKLRRKEEIIKYEREIDNIKLSYIGLAKSHFEINDPLAGFSVVKDLLLFVGKTKIQSLGYFLKP